MKTDAKAILYEQSTGRVRLTDKTHVVCVLLMSFKLKGIIKETMTYEEIAEKCKFNKVSNGIYNFKMDNSSYILIFLIDKTLEEFKNFLKKNNLPAEENWIPENDDMMENTIRNELNKYNLYGAPRVCIHTVDGRKGTEIREISFYFDDKNNLTTFAQVKETIFKIIELVRHKYKNLYFYMNTYYNLDLFFNKDEKDEYYKFYFFISNNPVPEKHRIFRGEVAIIPLDDWLKRYK